MHKCLYFDCGWCYHSDGPNDGCPGWYKCSVIGEVIVDLHCLSLTENPDISIDLDAEMHALLKNMHKPKEIKEKII